MSPEPEIVSLVPAARLALTLTTLVFVLVSLRALGRARLAETACLALGAPALVLSFLPLSSLALLALPVGVFVGVGLAIASLAHAPTRAAFDALDDGTIRTLLGYRATFGAFLIAGAALGSFPPMFAWTAGLGDLLVAWLAHAAPSSLARGGGRVGRLLVHGVGVLDLIEVIVLAMLVVRPWLFARFEADPSFAGPPLLLPWLGVPLMLALNVHGLRRAVAELRTASVVAAE